MHKSVLRLDVHVVNHRNSRMNESHKAAVWWTVYRQHCM